MPDDFDADLSRLLDQYDEKRNAVAERMRQLKADEAAFLAGFAELRRLVVRPVFEAAGAVLRARGHASSVSEDEYAIGQDGKSTEAKISIRILPAAYDGPPLGTAQCPSLEFVTRHYNRAVEMHVGPAPSRSGGPAGSRGEYQLAQITTNLVQTELLRLVAELARS